MSLPILGGLVFWIHSIYSQIKKLTSNVTKITTELTPNGGKSIKDVINKIKDDTESISNRLSSIELLNKFHLDLDDQIAIFRTDKQGNLIWANKGFLELVDKSMDEVSHYDWYNIVDQHERQHFIQAWNDCISNLQKFQYDFNLSTLHGPIPVRCKAEGMKNIGYVGVITRI
jgi:PAS domain-containing protein